MTRRAQSLARLCVFALALAIASCGAPGAATSGPASGDEQVSTEGQGDPDARHDPHAPDCGSSTNDWCAAPAQDPCGEHHDTRSCRSDSRCEGIPYSGEAAANCTLDVRCFASNCPTVGCVSRCETLREQTCEGHGYRCSWDGAMCERVEACQP